MAAVSKPFNALMKKICKGVTKVSNYCVEFCCNEGNLSLLQYFLDSGAPATKAAHRAAVHSWNLDCLKLLEERGVTFTQDELDESLQHATFYSSQDIVIHFLSKGAIPTEFGLQMAIESGRLELVKVLHSELVRTNQIDLAEMEANNGNDFHAFGMYAARSGTLEMVKYVEQFIPLKQSGISGAAYKGSVEVLQYYLDRGFHASDESICQIAAKEGHIDFLQFAVTHGAPLSAKVMESLVSRTGSLSLIREMREKGCTSIHRFDLSIMYFFSGPWNGDSIVEARDFEVLQYLIENGCPFTTRRGWKATLNAAATGNIQFLRYLMEHNVRCHKSIMARCPGYQRNKPKNESFTMVIKYLHGRGYQWSAKVSAFAARRGNLELLRFIHENQLLWDKNTCNNAVRYSQLECLEYAMKHGCA